jgi:GT2 family glycosyltransferase
MIPVFIAPVISRFDLLERMLSSVNEPVERGVVIDNARSGYRLPGGKPGFSVFSPPFGSLGYTGSINFIIGQTFDAPWWFWASNDEVFGPADIGNVVALMEQAGDQPRIVTENYAWGALNRAVVDRIGLFDEWSFWPIYFDDQDYAYRAKLAGIEWVRYTGTVAHGAEGHSASLTIHSDEQLAKANAVSWDLNRTAYVAKWGAAPPDKPIYTKPWNKDLPLWTTQPDLAGRLQRMWKR